MTIEDLKSQIPDFGRDIRLNLDSVLSTEGAPGLTDQQIWGSALACAYALDSKDLVNALLNSSSGALNDDAYREAARGAATIMAMNNVYYRSTHLMNDEELRKLPTKLRMNIIGNPGIPKTDFEAMSLAVSAIAGCGQCLSAHAKVLKDAGVQPIGIQSLLRLASVLRAADQALRIARM